MHSTQRSKITRDRALQFDTWNLHVLTGMPTGIREIKLNRRIRKLTNRTAVSIRILPRNDNAHLPHRYVEDRKNKYEHFSSLLC